MTREHVELLRLIRDDCDRLLRAGAFSTRGPFAGVVSEAAAGVLHEFSDALDYLRGVGQGGDVHPDAGEAGS